MGVHGWAKVLQEQGYLPFLSSSSSSHPNHASTSLWRDTSTNHHATSSSSLDWTDRIQAIRMPVSTPAAAAATTTMDDAPPTLHLDGNGLAFHLHRVAYARHVQHVKNLIHQSKKNNHKNNHHNNSSKNKKRNIPPACSVSDVPIRHVTALLPSFLPLHELATVTVEFMTALQHAQPGCRILVYWDGDLRRITKQETDTHRRHYRISQEWSQLELYCEQGALPTLFGASSSTAAAASSSSSCLCHWEELFPKSRLFQAQIIHAVERMGGGSLVQNVICLEEADHVMARAATNRPHDYIVANDSDFCFFPQINYIPLTTLAVSSNATTTTTAAAASSSLSSWSSSSLASPPLMTGVVIRRDELAQTLGLSHESLLVELAILRGNDYLPDPRTAELDYYNNHGPHHHSKGQATVSECIQFLTERQDELNGEKQDGVSYQVTSPSPNTQEKMKFIRALYNLQNLDEFALQDPKLVEQQERRRLLLEQSMDSECTVEHDEMVIPDDLDVSLAKVQPLTDRSVKDAVLRCLQHYVNHQQQKKQGGKRGVQEDDDDDDDDDDQAGDGSWTTISASASGKMNLTQEHIDVFANLTMQEDLNEMVDKIMALHPRWRPLWSDVPAVYLIEKTIAMSLKLSADCPLVRLCPPYSFFDAYRFHAALQLHRQEKNAIKVENVKDNAAVKPAAEQPTTVVERPVLPIDEHEEVILQTVRDNRVTIIQGGTGCGVRITFFLRWFAKTCIQANLSHLTYRVWYHLSHFCRNRRGCRPCYFAPQHQMALKSKLNCLFLSPVVSQPRLWWNVCELSSLI